MYVYIIYIYIYIYIKHLCLYYNIYIYCKHIHTCTGLEGVRFTGCIIIQETSCSSELPFVAAAGDGLGICESLPVSSILTSAGDVFGGASAMLAESGRCKVRIHNYI